MPLQTVKFSMLQTWKAADANRVPDNVLQAIDSLDGAQDNRLGEWQMNHPGYRANSADTVDTNRLSQRRYEITDWQRQLRTKAEQGEKCFTATPQQVADWRSEADRWQGSVNNIDTIANWMRGVSCNGHC